MWTTAYNSMREILKAAVPFRKATRREILSRGLYRAAPRSLELYVVYLKDQSPGPYPVIAPLQWTPVGNRKSFDALLEICHRHPGAQSLYLRELWSARDFSGTRVFPAGRWDMRLATRVATPLPADHPALKTPPGARRRSRKYQLYDGE